MVKAIIEVKSKINSSGNNNLRDIVKNFDRLENFEILKERIRENWVFSWIFAYEKGMQENRLRDQNKYAWVQLEYVNHISLWNNFFFKSWINNQQISPHSDSNVNWSRPFFNIYNIIKYSFGYFLSNLLHIVSSPNLEERSPFSFTIPDPYGKEDHLIQSIQIVTDNNHQN